MVGLTFGVAGGLCSSDLCVLYLSSRSPLELGAGTGLRETSEVGGGGMGFGEENLGSRAVQLAEGSLICSSDWCNLYLNS